jgi:hypothetical protein
MLTHRDDCIPCHASWLYQYAWPPPGYGPSGSGSSIGRVKEISCSMQRSTYHESSLRCLLWEGSGIRPKPAHHYPHTKAATRVHCDIDCDHVLH